jgi:hypothetical protein
MAIRLHAHAPPIPARADLPRTFSGIRAWVNIGTLDGE